MPVAPKPETSLIENPSPFGIRLSPPGILSATRPVMTPFAKLSSTTGISTAAYASQMTYPLISKLTSVPCPRFLYQEL